MSTPISPHPGVNPPAPRVSMTSKEWVIPPRPKPGRKPATDTPPTKRKAQNRAAQRAFRERRAARVGELEELLDKQKEDHDREDSEMKEKIRGLEMEVQSFKSKCLLLENLLGKERQERIRAETEAETLRRRNQELQKMNTHSSPAYQPRRSMSMQQNARQDSLPQIIPSRENADGLTCGRCLPNACACAEEAIASIGSPFGQNGLKRPVSPSAPTANEKRHRPSLPDLAPVDTNHEPPSAQDPVFKDGCGFCKDGTYCVCADTAMATPAMTPTTDTLPPMAQQVQTPPPSEPDASHNGMAMEITADGAVKLPKRNTAASRPAPVSRSCGPNGPGSCAQCKADPKSGLFCRLMAAKASREGITSGCCGGKRADGGCCKTKKSSITLPSLPSLGLTPAEAYQTLSSHKNFDRASDDIGSWLPKLRTTPLPEREGEQQQKMAPVEVEAASIMSVLKDFDVRFGSAV